MKPLFLHLVNVGPFRNEKIDFTALDDMFLVYGNTGAGKTTIFDAMTFALYGDLSGTRKKDAAGFRSDFAEAGDESFVEFTFELYHTVYRIRRTLPSVRLSKTGAEKKIPSELTLEKGEAASLFDEENEFTQVQGNLSELNARILAIINLSITEFTQIVLLPQGSFAQFLHAGSKEKRDMLSKLFPIDDYLKIMEKVKTLSDGYQEKSKVLEAELSRIYESGGMQDVQNNFDAISRELETLLSERKGLAEKIEKAAAAEEHLKHLLEDSLNAQVLREKSAELEKEKGFIEAKKVQLQNAAEAEKIAVYIKRAEETSAKLEKSVQLTESADKKLQAAQNLYAELLSKKDENAALKKKSENQVVELEHLKETRGKLLSLLDAKKTADQALAKKNSAEHELLDKKDALESLTAELFLLLPAAQSDSMAQVVPEAQTAPAVSAKDYSAALQRLFVLRQESQSELEKAKKTASDAKNAADLAENCRKTEENIKKSQELIASNNDLFKKASLCLDDYKEQKDAQEKNNFALALVPRLKPGEACPVCGSLDHPHPAASLPESLDIAEKIKTQTALVEKLRQETVEDEKSLASFTASFVQLQENLKKLHSEYDILPETDESQRALEAAEASCEKYKKIYGKSVSLGEKIKEKQKEIDVFSVTVSDLSRTAAAMEGARNALETQLSQSLKIESFADKQKAESVEQKAETISVQIKKMSDEITRNRSAVEQYEKSFHESEADCASLLSSLAELKKTLEESRTERDTALCIQKEKIEKSPFESAAQVKEAELESPQIEAIKIKIDEWTSSVQSVNARLESLKGAKPSGEIEQLSQKMQSDVDALHRQNIELDKKISSATEQKAQLQTQIKKIGELEQERRQLAQNGAHYAKLCRDLDGRNPKKIPFDAWVLGMYFEEVVSYANVRFERISGRRYRFKINMEAKGGNSLRGLDLMVSDSFTGKDRDTATLSGGETFMASISLALALTDVVQAQSGGIRLDSLFIDEGFGSLDSESLDMAISILQSIQESRMVGIISHVEGLVQAIPSRLEVIKGSGGSHVRIV